MDVESWTIKKAKLQRIDTFELWCWGRLLRVPWTAKSNQSILKEISPEYSLEALMLKLKLPILWPPYVKNWLIIGKDPNARKDIRQEEKGTTEDEMDGITDSMNMSQSKLWEVDGRQGSLARCSQWGCKESEMTDRLNWIKRQSWNCR